MARKFFFLASLAATAGIFLAIQACSSSETTTSETDSGTDGPVKPARDGAVVGDDAGDAGPATCPTTDTIAEGDLGRTWMPPFDVQSVCTQENIDSLKALYAANTDGGLTFTSIQAALDAGCSSCVFSPEISDGGLTPNWSVYVEVDGGAQGTLFVDNRTGSCFARYSNNTCGKLRWEFERCLRIACIDCTTTSATTQCKRDAQNGACKDITNSYATACPNETDLIADCDNIYKTIAASCSGGPDSGIDASL
jgi:hypothetical protein